MFLPPVCPICGHRGAAPCRACAAGLQACGSLDPPPGFDGCAALLVYEGGARELVARLKYRNARDALRWLAAGMAELASAPSPDLVTWIPTTAERRRQRGFDQAELLARAVARRGRWPARAVLGRRAGAPQTGRSAAERSAGPRLVVSHPRSVAGASVLLVDDVITTGASMRAAAQALRGAGASSVRGIAAAHTPPHVGLPSHERARLTTRGGVDGDHRQRPAHGGLRQTAGLGGPKDRTARTVPRDGPR